MKRYLIAIGGTTALLTALMPSADASRYSDWSTPVNLGPTINSSFVDGSPAISQDGLTLYFNSNRLGPDSFGDGDLYVARRDSVDLPWEWAVNLGDRINTASFEGFPALSRNEHHLFFVRPTPTGAGEIWVTYRKNVHDDLGDSGWESPTLLGPGVNTAAFEQGPSYFENRKQGLPQLYFHRSDGDIYVAEAFGSAIPVQELNSPQFDARPSISGDGLEIFFHSNRLESAGFDMWHSVRKSVLEPWSTPKNLGDIVNTPSNDFLGAISSDGETLYFTSDRTLDNFGGRDIYMTTRSKHRH